MSKIDRIRRLLPLFEQGRIFHRTLYDKTTVDLVDAFVETEYMAFPVAAHDDMLDCLARIEDANLNLKWPQSEGVTSRWAAAVQQREAVEVSLEGRQAWPGTSAMWSKPQLTRPQ